MRQRYEVRGNHLLFCRYGASADVNPDRALDVQGNDPIQSWPAQTLVATEAEHHAALVFLRDAQAGQCDDDQTDDPEIEDRKHPCSLAHYSMLSPCSEISRPSRSCSSATRNPMVLSITFKMTKLAANP